MKPRIRLRAGERIALLFMPVLLGLVFSGMTGSSAAQESPYPALPATAAQEGPHPAPPATAPHETKQAAPPETKSATPAAKRSRVPPMYESIPSLKDLYSQVDSMGGPVERFGISLFRGATASAAAASAAAASATTATATEDVSVTTDYLLGPGDLVNVDIWGGVNQHLTRLIDSQGRISLPDVGTVLLARHTVAQAQEVVSDALRREFKQVRADVSLARLRTVRVYVVGDVARPGAYTLSGNSTCINVLMAAGGPTETGSLRKLRHLRGTQLVREVDLYDFALHGLQTALEAFENGDTLVVPTIGSQVAVMGAVRRPAIYELRDERSLDQVLRLAGGVPVAGTLREVTIDRILAHKNRTTVTFQLPEKATPDQVEQQLKSFVMQDGDRVSIQSILPYSEQTVYVEGHVFRPGKLQFHEGMTVGEVIHSYEELLPEPSQHAEIVRLSPPDYRPTVVSFNLDDVMAHRGAAIPVQPFDTVRIFGRYEYDAPKVFIRGEVLRPGDYPLQENMTAADLVRLAGGLKRSAYTGQADLSRYEINDGRQILTEHRDIPIGDALSGKPDTDVLLHVADVLSIRQVSGWADVGSTVTISGEVQYPGSYGIEKGERLSSMLRRAGWFRDAAYPAGAVLERVQVREFAERSRSEMLSKLKLQAALANSTTGGDADSKKDAAAMAERAQQIQSELMSRPPSGRLVINISQPVAKWENTSDDLEVRPGDRIFIPKRPEFVLVDGQVFNASARAYVPGQRASWYLRGTGGPTRYADVKNIFVIRANGQVVGQNRGQGFWADHVLDTRMEPGDTLVVPEKIATGSSTWKNLIQAAQVMSALAIAARVATSF